MSAPLLSTAQLLQPENLLVLVINIIVIFGNALVMTYFICSIAHSKRMWSLPHLIVIINAAAIISQIVGLLIMYMPMGSFTSIVMGISLVVGLLCLLGLMLLQLEIRIAFSALLRARETERIGQPRAIMVLVLIHIFFCWADYMFLFGNPTRFTIWWHSIGLPLQVIWITSVSMYQTVVISKQLFIHHQNLGQPISNSKSYQITVPLVLGTVLGIAAVGFVISSGLFGSYPPDSPYYNPACLFYQLATICLGCEVIFESVALLSFTLKIASWSSIKTPPSSNTDHKETIAVLGYSRLSQLSSGSPSRFTI
ncbi:hypothetical protein QVD99_000721 [Batrachochytrium dendrobatidis]|nr:hypothetical protein O5D80_003571 [Batrachochytrium dendrobatidis]KAK5673266.1 hypothetical protein QVD99_000721 [Batrachochytrium dendrobatidis]